MRFSKNWRAYDVFRTSCVIKTQFNMKMEGANAKKGHFSWTEEETALLLKVILYNKTAKLAGGQVWEDMRTKYNDISSKFRNNFSKQWSVNLMFGSLAQKARITYSNYLELKNTHFRQIT